MTVFERATSPCKGQCSKLKKKCYRLSFFFCLLNTIMEVCDFQLCKSRAGCQAENKIYSFFFLRVFFLSLPYSFETYYTHRAWVRLKKKPDSLQSLHERYGTPTNSIRTTPIFATCVFARKVLWFAPNWLDDVTSAGVWRVIKVVHASLSLSSWAINLTLI